MQRYIFYLTTLVLAALLSSCEDVNVGNLFYTNCDIETRFESSMEENTTHQPFSQSVPEEYSFVVCSDLHLNQEENPYILQFLSPTQHQDAHFIIYNGDISQGHEEDAKAACELLKTQTKLPYYFSAGNHDLYFGWYIYQRYFGSSTYSITIATPSANDLILVLESASGTLGVKQMDWLKKQLTQERGKYRNCFIVTHTNFSHLHVANSSFMSDELQVLYRLFADHHVTAVFSGHAHAQHETTYLGVPYYTTDALKNGAYGQMTVGKKQCTWEFKQL